MPKTALAAQDRLAGPRVYKSQVPERAWPPHCHHGGSFHWTSYIIN
ncbi:hypothetical protein PMI15_01786 [Polaromonas sp. CF318]|nr:hypothetical protein PMI15_01786 [Polaromonas sp. CF318]